MLREDSGLGSILVVRSPPKPFSAREQALLQSLADQAAIAIQNARLFNETKEALGRQTRRRKIPRHRPLAVGRAAGVRGHCGEREAANRGENRACLSRDRGHDSLGRLGTALPTEEEEAALLALYPRPYAEFVLCPGRKGGRAGGLPRR